MQILASFAYAGPNRRSDLTVMEHRVELGASELTRLDGHGAALTARLEGFLNELLGAERPALPSRPAGGHARPEDRFGCLYAASAIVLQNAAAHIVREIGTATESTPGYCRAYFEYEEEETGYAAAGIARNILQSLLDAETDAAEGPEVSRLREQVRQFIEEARPHAMPHDARAIFEAARRRDIPCFRMDRPPYNPIEGDFRLRPNALFRLGHGYRQRTVDGTFCVDLAQSTHALIRDRRKLFRKLETLDVPLPSGRHSSRFCLSAGRAARVAGQRGFPVAVRPASRSDGRAVALDLRDAAAVRKAANEALQLSEQVLVEPFVAGRTYRLVLAGGRLLAVLEEGGAARPGEQRLGALDDAHPTHQKMSERIAADLNAGLLVVTVVTPDLGRELRQAGGAVVDVDAAPRLDRLFAPDDPVLHAAAEGFVDWMFPNPADARIPIVAVTGTNGKTTTCRMVARIMESAGYRTGLACSDGSYIQGERISQYEDGYLPGHLTVLDNPGVDMAVLESTRGGAGSTGLGFDRCNAAACLNVTADHLNDAVGTRTVDDLATLKGWIVERASDAAVLNADDDRCLAMSARLAGRHIGLTSLRESGARLLERAGPRGVAVVAETVGNRSWVVLYGTTGREAIMAVSEIPVTFDGRARHNVSNALHAVALCHLMGVGTDAIVRGLSGLESSFEAVPGRLNFHRGLPFDVLMDYAHNPDGMHHMCRFTDQLPVKGRRILALSCAAYNSDQFIRDTAAAAAGHFDHYVCKNFGNLFDRSPEEGPRLLREGLCAGGVTSDDITCIPDEFEAIDAALTMGREGDLVVVLAGKRKQAVWDRIDSFAERHGVQRRASNSVGQRSPSS